MAAVGLLVLVIQLIGGKSMSSKLSANGNIFPTPMFVFTINASLVGFSSVKIPFTLDNVTLKGAFPSGNTMAGRLTLVSSKGRRLPFHGIDTIAPLLIL